MALDLRDITFTGPAMPGPFVRYKLEDLLVKKKLLARESKAAAKDTAERWRVYQRKLRALGEGKEVRVTHHVLEPLIERLGYASLESSDKVSTREGNEDGGALLRAEDGTTLRAWAVSVGTDLDAPNKRGRAYRFSPSLIAQRVLLAKGERIGLLTDGQELRIVLSDPSGRDSNLSIDLTRGEGWRGARDVPDSYRLVRALCQPRGVAAIGALLDDARLAQTGVTKKLREQARRAVERFIQGLLDAPENRDARDAWGVIALRDELSLSYLFISHDLSVVKHISNRIAVMYLGQIVELADADQLFRNPAHPYTRSLLSAIPLPDPRHRQARVVLEGDVPTPLNPPSGCRFHTRCPAAFERCPQEEPELIVLGANHTTKCHHADGLEGNDAWFEELDRRITKQEELNRAKAAASSQPAPAPAQQSQARPRRTAAAPHSQPHSEAARDKPRHLARACVLAGLLAVVLGLWLLGAALVLAAYVIAIRKNLERPLPADIGIFAALVLALLVSDAVKSQSAQTRARHELNALAQHIEAYRTAAQSPPNSLTELGWRLYEIFPDGRPTDPWGRLYTYDPPSPDRDGRISSEGPSPDRKDDLVVRIPP